MIVSHPATAAQPTTTPPLQRLRRAHEAHRPAGDRACAFLLGFRRWRKTSAVTGYVRFPTAARSGYRTSPAPPRFACGFPLRGTATRSRCCAHRASRNSLPTASWAVVTACIGSNGPLIRASGVAGRHPCGFCYAGRYACPERAATSTVWGRRTAGLNALGLAGSLALGRACWGRLRPIPPSLNAPAVPRLPGRSPRLSGRCAALFPAPSWPAEMELIAAYAVTAPDSGLSPCELLGPSAFTADPNRNVLAARVM
jgi:hypothetical protein